MNKTDEIIKRDYTIIRGDCLKYLSQIDDNSVDLILTDPPYNIAKYSTGNINLPGRSALNNDLGNWDLAAIDPFAFVDEFKRIIKPNGNIFVFTSYNQIGKWHEAFDSEFDTFQFFIWHKTNPAPKIFKNGFLNSCEMIVCMWNKGHKWNFSAQNKMHNFFESPICMRPERLSNPKHPAQKPVKLLEHLLKIASDEGDTVFDPFMGVGSTGVAALKNKRKFIGIEIEEEYFDAAANRISSYGGNAMDETKQNLQNFIENEMELMTQNMLAAFDENMENRKINPFLAFEDYDIKKYMALSRSFDSQLGNRIQRMIFYISRIRYGNAFVPNLITLDIADEKKRDIRLALYYVPFDIKDSEVNKDFKPYKQTIHVNKNLSPDDVKKQIKLKKKSKALKYMTFDFKEIDKDTFEYLKALQGKTIFVDLLFFECDEAKKTLHSSNAFEIKMGGKLDTKNASSNAEEVLHLSRLFGFIPSNLAYFATCYGHCSNAVERKIEKILGKDAVLNGKEFWKKIFPTGETTLSYEEFISMYQGAFLKSDLEEKLKAL